MFIENGEFRPDGSSFYDWVALLFTKLEEDLKRVGVTNVVRKAFTSDIDLSSTNVLNSHNLPSWMLQPGDDNKVLGYYYRINGTFNYRSARNILYFTVGGFNVAIYQYNSSVMIYTYAIERDGISPVNYHTGQAGTMSENEINTKNGIGSMGFKSTYQLVSTPDAFHIQFFNKGYLPTVEVTLCKSGSSSIINTIVTRLNVDIYPAISGISPTVSFGSLGENSIYNQQFGDMITSKMPRFDVNVGFTNFGLIGKLKGVYALPYEVKMSGSLVSFNGEIYKNITAYYTTSSGSHNDIFSNKLFIKC